MSIKDRLLESQPEVYLKLMKLIREPGPQVPQIPQKKELTERDIHECMSHGAWKRGKGGAMRQVRW